jgi:hypothetical protein
MAYIFVRKLHKEILSTQQKVCTMGISSILGSSSCSATQLIAPSIVLLPEELKI